MTSEEYARQVGKFMLTVARDEGVSREQYAYRRLFSMTTSRIMFDGREEYSENEDTKQAIEVKPLPALIQDIEEEIADLVSYTVALSLRDGTVRNACKQLVFLGLQMMQVTGEFRAESD